MVRQAEASVGDSTVSQLGFAFDAPVRASVRHVVSNVPSGTRVALQSPSNLVPPVILSAPPKNHTGVRPVPAEAYGYQVDGIAWLDDKGSGILADDCGLGKTLQACVAADAPVLIVCPAAMRVEWQREMARWRPEFSVVVVTGRKPCELDVLQAADVVIVNYDILFSHLPNLRQVKTATLIADEAQVLINLAPASAKERKKKDGAQYEGSTRAKAFRELSILAKRKFLLTATPMMNRPIELWPLLHYLDPVRWFDYVAFGKYFCNGKLEQKPRGKGMTGKKAFHKVWNFQGRSNERKLHRVLSKDYMLRRTKHDVLDLPEKTRRTIMVALDDKSQDTYDAAERDFAAWVKEQGGVEALKKHLSAPAVTKMTALRHLAAVGKLDYAVDYVVKHLESTSRRLIVMAHHRDVTLGLVERLLALKIRLEFDEVRPIRVGKIIGGMTEKQRIDDKDSFQAGELDVIVCSIAAAGVGLTLTAASDTLFVERCWRPADLIQAEDRCHRIGQTNKVSITYLDAVGTIDEAVGSLLLDKRATFAKVIDGVDCDEMQATKHVFGALFGLQRRQNPKQRMLAAVAESF